MTQPLVLRWSSHIPTEFNYERYNRLTGEWTPVSHDWVNEKRRIIGQKVLWNPTKRSLAFDEGV